MLGVLSVIIEVVFSRWNARVTCLNIVCVRVCVDCTGKRVHTHVYSTYILWTCVYTYNVCPSAMYVPVWNVQFKSSQCLKVIVTSCHEQVCVCVHLALPLMKNVLHSLSTPHLYNAICIELRYMYKQTNSAVQHTHHSAPVSMHVYYHNWTCIRLLFVMSTCTCTCTL